MGNLVSRIAIILARGGSKRLPRKNILPLGGKPMVAWTVEAAVGSGRFDRVLVSTDDAEIAEIGRTAGAEVPFLRDAAADDISPSSEATLAALDQAESHWGERYETVAQLMANCPLRNADDIADAVDAFAASGGSAQISCFKFGWMNPWWAVELGPDKRPKFKFPEAMKARSQDLPPLYCPTGAIWLARPDALRKARTFYTDDHVFHPMSWISAVDIDDAEDFKMAEACFSLRSR